MMFNMRGVTMRVRGGVALAALGAAVAMAATAGTASACSTCHRTPCVIAAPAYCPPPAYQCVTEMVPYTVTRPRTRIDYREETITVPEMVPETTFVERQRLVCRPVFNTVKVPRRVVSCRPVFDTVMVNQCVTVCRPETTTCQVTEYCMQPTTQYVNVPVRTGHCGRCGRAPVACGCQTVAQVCYTPVPVVRNVSVTRMVPEVQTRQVPVTTCRMVREERVEEFPVTTCQMVQEVVTEKIPCTKVRCVPRQVTRRIPFPVCEMVTETCYRPVSRMVPVVPVAPAVAPTAQASAAPSGQAGPSGQQ
jgi:hypothetical protein